MAPERSRARSGAWLRPPLLRLSQATLCPMSRRGQYVGALHERSLDIGPPRRSTLSVPYADGTLARQNTLATTCEATTPQRSSGRPATTSAASGSGRASISSERLLDTDLFVAIVERVDEWSEAGPLPQDPQLPHRPLTSASAGMAGQRLQQRGKCSGPSGPLGTMTNRRHGLVQVPLATRSKTGTTVVTQPRSPMTSAAASRR